MVDSITHYVLYYGIYAGSITTSQVSSRLKSDNTFIIGQDPKRVGKNIMCIRWSFQKFVEIAMIIWF